MFEFNIARKPDDWSLSCVKHEACQARSGAKSLPLFNIA
jgi:hypothetical protein